MRDIKFRAWDTGIGTENKGMLQMSPGQSLCDFFAYIEGCRDSYDTEWELMQYTGLKDKNGKEIYEGDILKHDLWGLTTVIWEHGMFRGQSENEEYDVTLADHQLARCHVIGNIYENPELLKGNL